MEAELFVMAIANSDQVSLKWSSLLFFPFVTRNPSSVLWCYPMLEPRAGHDVWMTDGQKINQSPKVPLVGMSCGVPEYITSFCLENNYCSLCHYHEILKRHWFPDSLQVYKHNSSVNVQCQFTKRVQSFALITPIGDWHKQKTVFLCLHKTKTLNWTEMLHTREHTHKHQLS